MAKHGKGTKSEQSRALCLAALRDLGDATVTKVADRTGLSRPTVEAALTRLAAGSLVEHQVDHVPSGEAGGRPARISRFRAHGGCVAGLDLSGAKVRVALADLSGRVLAGDHDAVPCPSDQAPGLDAVSDALDLALQSAGLGRSDVQAAGVGLAGIVRADGTLVSSPSVRSWAGSNLRDRLTKHLRLPVTVDNDLSLAAIGEARLGALRGAHTGVFVLTWHHVSARITIDGNVLRGRNDSAGEVGLLRSFSGIAYPKGLLTEASAAYAARLERLVIDPHDARGTLALKELTTAMTPAVAALVLALDPDVVILGGHLGRYADAIAPLLRASVSSYIEGDYLPEAIITGSMTGADGVCYGSIHRAFESFSAEIYGTAGVAPPVLTLGAPSATADPSNVRSGRA